MPLPEAAAQHRVLGASEEALEGDFSHLQLPVCSRQVAPCLHRHLGASQLRAHDVLVHQHAVCA